MSITRSVHRRLRSVAPIAIVSALALASAVAVAPASARTGAPGRGAVGARPGRAPASSDPTARIASLTALVAQRESATVDAKARRDQTVDDLSRAWQAEYAALARAQQLSEEADAAQQRYGVAREAAGRVAAASYRNSGNGAPLAGLLAAKSATEYGYRQKITEAAGDAQMDVVRRALRIRRTATRLAAEANRQKYRYRDLVERLERLVPERDREYERGGIRPRERQVLVDALAVDREWRRNAAHEPLDSQPHGDRSVVRGHAAQGPYHGANV